MSAIKYHIGVRIEPNGSFVVNIVNALPTVTIGKILEAVKKNFCIPTESKDYCFVFKNIKLAEDISIKNIAKSGEYILDFLLVNLNMPCSSLHSSSNSKTNQTQSGSLENASQEKTINQKLSDPYKDNSSFTNPKQFAKDRVEDFYYLSPNQATFYSKVEGENHFNNPSQLTFAQQLRPFLNMSALEIRRVVFDLVKVSPQRWLSWARSKLNSQEFCEGKFLDHSAGKYIYSVFDLLNHIPPPLMR